MAAAKKTPRASSEKEKSRSILSYFTPGRQPREGQKLALERIEKDWAKTDVFVVEIPTGGGKSDLALTLLRWASAQHKQKGMCIVPNNVLLQQYLDSNPRMATIRGKHDYECAHGSTELTGKMSCKEYSAKMGHTCKGVCPYTAANRKIRAVPYGVVNFYTYLAHRLYPDALVIDEAHNLLGMLRDFAAKKLWQHVYQYPDYIRDYSSLLKWVKDKRFELQDAGYPQDSKLEALYKDLNSGAPKYLVEKGVDLHFGKEKSLLKLLPIDTSDQPPILWPNQVRKLILLSATIGPKDLEQLGLDGRRVSWIATPSPIPPQNRPIVVQEPGLDLSYAGIQKELPNLLKEIGRIADKHPGQRGIVHTTYSLMQALGKEGIIQEGGRFLIHNKENKKEKYAEFLTGKSDAILICAGLYEGIDLPGDLGRFQIITKVPWPNLAEPAYKYLAQTDRDRYCYETLKTVMQGAGRVCRTPTDYGITYILDRTFQNIPEELMPAWFRQALEAGETV